MKTKKISTYAISEFDDFIFFIFFFFLPVDMWMFDLYQIEGISKAIPIVFWSHLTCIHFAGFREKINVFFLVQNETRVNANYT